MTVTRSCYWLCWSCLCRTMCHRAHTQREAETSWTGATHPKYRQNMSKLELWSFNLPVCLLIIFIYQNGRNT